MTSSLRGGGVGVGGSEKIEISDDAGSKKVKPETNGQFDDVTYGRSLMFAVVGKNEKLKFITYPKN